ncbi:DoxX family protein [Allosphingosinicella deserti]|uniref:LysR family transcriptional regulator n=1 Tax=Allosphingosinicella deserti TaxID=2116704 RepID=A0A2P7QRR9_9SPHN|nr:DoxX family protein [Sphingomonas deserti]PSJ40649.1 LysR family transcriptional regulator [Sphingomonas deserti]
MLTTSPASTLGTSSSSIGTGAGTAALANSVLPLVGRIGLAAIFVLSGVSKLTAPQATIGYIASVGLPFPTVALAAAILVELAGGALLIAGYRTRLVAALLAAFSVVTALTFHADLGDQNQFIHFLKNIAMAGGLLQIVAFGAGRFSFDNRR